MRLIVDLAPSEPSLGLACEESLFRSAIVNGESLLHLWVNGRAIVIGRAQGIAAEVDVRAAEAEAVPVLRRISGGGAVFHYPGNLNVSVVAPSRETGSVADCFVRLGAAICEGLSKIGICAVSSGNRLLVDGKKVGGAAQARRGGFTLYHTTLLIAPPDRPIAHLLRAGRPGYRPNGVASKSWQTTTLTQCLGRPLSLDQAAAAVRQGLHGVCTLEEDRLGAREMAQARDLAETKYGSASWNASR